MPPNGDRARAERPQAERPLYDWDGLNEETAWDSPFVVMALVAAFVSAFVVVGWQVLKALRGWS